MGRWSTNLIRIVLLMVLTVAVFGVQPASAIDRQQCKFQSLQEGVWTQREENYTARCVVRRWSVPGGLAKVKAVGSCESGWNRFARNGQYVGLFQHDQDAWVSRVTTFEPPNWRLSRSWTNSRSQITTTVRMAHRPKIGWDPWSGCS